jgi:hypothetical protein
LSYWFLNNKNLTNIYLSVPAIWGELEIWDVDPLPTSVIHKRDPDLDWRTELPQSIIIKPNKR